MGFVCVGVIRERQQIPSVGSCEQMETEQRKEFDVCAVKCRPALGVSVWPCMEAIFHPEVPIAAEE